MKENKLAYQLKDKAIWVVFLVLVIAFTIANPRFINPTNLFTMIRQVSFYGIASIGMTFVILLGDIDLSTGTIISFVNIICAYFMVNMGMPMVVAIILTLAIAINRRIERFYGIYHRHSGIDCHICHTDIIFGTYIYHLRRSAHQRIYREL